MDPIFIYIVVILLLTLLIYKQWGGPQGVNHLDSNEKENAYDDLRPREPIPRQRFDNVQRPFVPQSHYPNSNGIRNRRPMQQPRRTDPLNGMNFRPHPRREAFPNPQFPLNERARAMPCVPPAENPNVSVPPRNESVYPTLSRSHARHVLHEEKKEAPPPNNRDANRQNRGGGPSYGGGPSFGGGRPYGGGPYGGRPEGAAAHANSFASSSAALPHANSFASAHSYANAPPPSAPKPSAPPPPSAPDIQRPPPVAPMQSSSSSSSSSSSIGDGGFNIGVRAQQNKRPHIRQKRTREQEQTINNTPAGSRKRRLNRRDNVVDVTDPSSLQQRPMRRKKHEFPVRGFQSPPRAPFLSATIAMISSIPRVFECIDEALEEEKCDTALLENLRVVVAATVRHSSSKRVTDTTISQRINALGAHLVDNLRRNNLYQAILATFGGLVVNREGSLMHKMVTWKGLKVFGQRQKTVQFEKNHMIMSAYDGDFRHAVETQIMDSSKLRAPGSNRDQNPTQKTNVVPDIAVIFLGWRYSGNRNVCDNRHQDLVEKIDFQNPSTDVNSQGVRARKSGEFSYHRLLGVVTHKGSLTGQSGSYKYYFRKDDKWFGIAGPSVSHESFAENAPVCGGRNIGDEVTYALLYKRESSD